MSHAFDPSSAVADPRLAALRALAASVADRALPVAWGPAGVPSQVMRDHIAVDPELSPLERRCAVVAQALWVTYAAQASGVNRAALSRPRPAALYAEALLAWGLRQRAAQIPEPVSRHLTGLMPTMAPRNPEAAWVHARSGKNPAVLPRCVGILRPHALVIAASADAAGSFTGSTPPTRVANERDTEEGEASSAGDALLERLRSPLRGLGLTDVLLKLLDFKRSSGSVVEGDADGAAALAHSAAAQRTPRGALHAVLSRVLLAVRGPVRRGHRYPEWDASRHAYRVDHTCVAEIDPLPDPTTTTPPAPTPLPGLLSRLKRIGAVFEHVRGEPKGNELDLDACIDQRVRRRAGDTPRGNVYISARPTRRDLSVMLLLDISRSTADVGPEGATQLQVHARLAEQLVAAFERLGDRVALFGFHSYGREQVRLIRVKAFDDRWSHSRVRLGTLMPSGMTRTGAAIRHAARRLTEQRHHHRRLLIVLSDGFPYDDGYENATATQDTRRALAEMATEGVATVCLHIGSEQHDEALASTYGDGAWLRVPDTRHLVPRLSSLIEQALSRADQSRSRRLTAAGRMARGQVTSARHAPTPGEKTGSLRDPRSEPATLSSP